MAGLGIEAAEFGDHVADVVGIDLAERSEAGEIALGDHVEMSDQDLHGGIEAVQFLELEHQAFLEIAREDAGRIEALEDARARARHGRCRCPAFRPPAPGRW